MDQRDGDAPGEMTNAHQTSLQDAENLQYTKKIVVEQQRAQSEPEAPIVAPVIRIERQRLESSATKVHEYMLPVDAAWEFPRENLNLGKVRNKQGYHVLWKYVS